MAADSSTILDGLPREHFASIVCDPPWKFRPYIMVADQKGSRAIERHYRCMSIADITAIPVSAVAARDAHLWLWTTGPHLQNSFQIIESYGFKYSGMGMVWVKLRRSLGKQLRLLSSADMERELHCGLGYTTRKNAEFCLLARRGNARRIGKNIREIILSPVREHSRKPDEAYERIERYAAGPFLEIFGRQERVGWTVVGDEVGKF